jgi:hypothetical protein
MIKVRTEDAVGKVLAYDTTYVGPDNATVLLKKGHVITEEDVEKLKNSGVYYVWVEGEEEPGYVYEWDITPYVAERVIGENLYYQYAGQGLTRVLARVPGVLRVDAERLTEFNENGNVLVITHNNNRALGKNELAAVVEVIPLKIRKEELESLKYSRFLRLDPFKLRRVGAVITGTEVYEGRKKDAYLPVIKSKCEKYEWELVYHEFVPDDDSRIAKGIMNALDKGAEAVIVTGGMSVDATDRTVPAILSLGAELVAYGIPMKPTTMTAVAYLDNKPIFAISAGGIYYSEWNSIDVVFTRLMTGERLTKRDIASLGLGGLTDVFLRKAHKH